MAGLVLALAVTGATGAAQSEAREAGAASALRPGSTIAGEIADGDPVVETDTLRAGYTDAPTLGRSYRLEVGEPGAWRVELRSCFFDAYLVVRDAAGQVVAEDDDGLIGTQARVVLDVEAGASLRVEVCALHGQRGAFELGLQPGRPQALAPPDRQAAAIADARECLGAVEAALGPDHPLVATRLNNLAARLRTVGAYGEARPLLERALAIREAALGPDHLHVATSLSNLGMLVQAMGEYAEARPLLERALAITEAARGPEHPDVAESLNNLAVLLEELGAYAEARPLYERALAINERALGPDHPEVASTLNNLAVLLRDLGEYEEARPLYERSLAIYERALGPDHTNVATSLNNLASLLQAMGEYGEARPLYERSLATFERALGPDHPVVAQSLNKLAGLLSVTGEYGEARALFERSLAISQAALGPDHPIVATSQAELAAVLLAMGEFREAQPLFERALAIREAALGPDHPLVATTLSNLAALLHRMGEYAEARRLLERSLAIREAALGPSHLEVAITLNNLAMLLTEMGAYEEARPLFERSLAIHEAALGPDHPAVAMILSNLGVLLHGMGADREARPLLERSLAIREAALGSDQQEVAASLSNLASVLRELGESSQARPLFERSLAIREAALGPDHPDVATSLGNLAALLQALGEYDEARPLLERSLAIREAALGPEHPDVVANLNELAVLELDLGAGDAAAALVARAGAGRARHVLSIVQGSSEAELARYASMLAWQVQLEQSPALREGRELASYSSLLAWKGQILRAARAGRAALRERIGAEGRALADRLYQVTSMLSRTAAEAGGGSPLNAAQLDHLIQERQRLERELAPLAVDLLPPPLAWSELRDALPPGAALVDLFIHPTYEPARREGGAVVEPGHWGPERVSAWITRAEFTEPVHVDLGPLADIEAASRPLLEFVGRARGERLPSLPASPLSMVRLVWEPLRPHLADIETVIVSPDGVLATVPFEVLRDDEGRYLVEQRGFVYLTDPTDLARLGPAARPPSPSLLCVGDVDFDAAGDGGAAQGASTTAAGSLPGPPPARWARLASTAEEESAVLAAHEAAFAEARRLELTGQAASEERLKASMPEFGVLHLATHGFFNPAGPPSLQDGARQPADAASGPVAQRVQGYSPGLLSGLVCAGANASPAPPSDDGCLTAEEAGWLDLSGCDLVVLSACDTGLGRPQSGEGLLGLRRAFLTAGARTVISSLWAVPDQETAELMGLFYENLWQKGLGKHAALRAAQLEMIRRNRERQGGDARPVTWGAFVLDGDWR